MCFVFRCDSNVLKITRFLFLFLAGTEQFKALRDLYFRNSQGFVLIYAVNDPYSFQELKEIAQNIVRAKDSDKVPMILVSFFVVQ